MFWGFFESLNFDLSAIKIPLNGSHQIENAQLVISCVKHQNLFKINDEILKMALKKLAEKPV